MSATSWRGHVVDVEHRRAAWLDSIAPGAGPRHSRDAEAAGAGEPIAVTPVHRTIVAVDIEGFGDHRRTNTNQVRVRRGLYKAMRHAFESAGVAWNSCHREDRGDGLLVLASAEVRKSLFVDRLPGVLAAALSRHNETHPPEEQIRLRLALHAGEVNYDDHGVTSTSITHTFRLVNARALKEVHKESPAVLAIIASSWFFDEVIRHNERNQPDFYRPVTVTNKETTMPAWIRLLG
jgi:hypothetical protein